MCQCFPRINSSGKGKSFSFNKYCQIALQSFCTNLSSSLSNSQINRERLIGENKQLYYMNLGNESLE